jgi:hypothetical protein
VHLSVYVRKTSTSQPALGYPTRTATAWKRWDSSSPSTLPTSPTTVALSLLPQRLKKRRIDMRSWRWHLRLRLHLLLSSIELTLTLPLMITTIIISIRLVLILRWLILRWSIRIIGLRWRVVLVMLTCVVIAVEAEGVFWKRGDGRRGEC